MTVWIDGDSCPRAVREIVARRCRREGVALVIIADRDVSIPGYPEAWMQIVESGADAADAAILKGINADDLLITRDLILAEAAVERGAVVLNDSGSRFDAGNVAERRSLRDFSVSLRRNGLAKAGPHRYGKRQLAAFANRFDAEVTKRLNGR